jgi:hypothetical protein
MDHDGSLMARPRRTGGSRWGDFAESQEVRKLLIQMGVQEARCAEAKVIWKLWGCAYTLLVSWVYRRDKFG